jgi:hypothetical protein
MCMLGLLPAVCRSSGPRLPDFRMFCALSMLSGLWGLLHLNMHRQMRALLSAVLLFSPGYLRGSVLCYCVVCAR